MSQKRLDRINSKHTHTHTHTKSISKMLHSIFTQNLCYIKLSEALGKSGFKLICYSD